MKNGLFVAGFLGTLLITAPVFGATPPGGEGAAQHARAAVADAQAAVQQAAEKRALWTTAQDALLDAEKALTQHNYAAVERFARFAAEQARLGIEQLSYPPFRGYASLH